MDTSKQDFKEAVGSNSTNYDPNRPDFTAAAEMYFYELKRKGFNESEAGLKELGFTDGCKHGYTLAEERYKKEIEELKSSVTKLEAMVKEAQDIGGYRF
jgi:hypothetical protein